MGLTLIPVGDRGDVVGEPFVFAVRAPAQGLNGHAHVLLVADRIENVPAVQAPVAGYLGIVAGQDCAGIGRAVRLRETIAAAEIVLRPSRRAARARDSILPPSRCAE